MPTGEIEYTLERGEEIIPLTIELDYSPIIPARTYGPPEDCYPAEGAEIENIRAYYEKGRFALTDDEIDKITEWLYDNYTFDDSPEYYED